MIIMCPYCGVKLNEKVNDGFASCHNCQQAFDSCPYNRLLSLCWYVRKRNVQIVNELTKAGFDEAESIIALALAGDSGFTHDECQKFFNKIGVSKKYI